MNPCLPYAAPALSQWSRRSIVPGSCPTALPIAGDFEPWHFAELKHNRAFSATLSHQYRGVDDPRTWFENTTDYFKLPALSEAAHGDTVAETTRAA
jgi:hypothetical protein